MRPTHHRGLQIETMNAAIGEFVKYSEAQLIVRPCAFLSLGTNVRNPSARLVGKSHEQKGQK